MVFGIFGHLEWWHVVIIRFFKPPPPVGTGGGYMFSGHPSVLLCVRASVRDFHVVVLCFRDISCICWRIFAKLLSLVHLGTQMTWLHFWVKRSKCKVTRIAVEAHSTRRYRWVQLFWFIFVTFLCVLNVQHCVNLIIYFLQLHVKNLSLGVKL